MSLAERPRAVPGRLAGGALPGPSAADWAGALLTSGTEGLIGAVRNYLGPVKTPYDKRELASRLEAFLRREETRASILSLLDPLDARIVGSALLAGPCAEPALRELFVGELPLFDLGLRIDNLLDRLILFRFQSGGRRLVAVNPILEADLRRITLDPESLLGRSGAAAGAGAGGGAPVTAELSVGFFSFVFHSPSSLRKSGGLTKKGAERAAALFPALAQAGRIDGLARAFAAAGLFRAEGDCRAPDRDAFARELAAWGRDLPYYLAAALALAEEAEAEERGEPSPEAPAPSAERRARELGAAMAAAMAALPEAFAPARSALPRWLRIVARRLGLSVDASAAAGALEALGFAAAPGRAARGGGAEEGAGAAEGKRGPTLVAEGSHALHLMPEASLEERLLVGSAARPISLEKVWSFEVERETARRAFASGLGASALRAALEGMSGARLPQSLAFSLSEWEEEYRSLRLYRGFVLVADERQRPLVERSAALGRIVAEALAPGVYFLSAATQEEAAEALAAAGLEAPPAAESSKAAGLGARPTAAVGAAGSRGSADGDVVAASAQDPGFWTVADGAAMGADGEAAAAPLDPGPRLAELRAAVATSGRSEEERRELGERVERRLVLTERQIAESDPRSERLEAGGLDYLGKVRVVERALRGRGDRLEVLYRLPGAEPVRALLRPVRLERNDKGLVLEAEDLGTGGPARVPLGAVSTVRRVRASLFGEEQ